MSGQPPASAIACSSVDPAGLAEDLDRQDRPGPRSGRGRDQVRIEAQRLLLDVDEPRHGPLVHDAVGRRDEAERRRDDLVALADAERAHDHVQPGGAAAARHAEPAAGERRRTPPRTDARTGPAPGCRWTSPGSRARSPAVRWRARRGGSCGRWSRSSTERSSRARRLRTRPDGLPATRTDGGNDAGPLCGVRATQTAARRLRRGVPATTSGIVLGRRALTSRHGRLPGPGPRWGSDVDVRRQLRIARSWIPLLIASVLLAGGVAFVITSGQPSVYEAQATDHRRAVAVRGQPGLQPTAGLAATVRDIRHGRDDRTDPDQGHRTGSASDVTAAQPAGQVIVVASPDTALLSITAQAGKPRDRRRHRERARGRAHRRLAGRRRPARRHSSRPSRQDIAAIRLDIQETQAKIDDLLWRSRSGPSRRSRCSRPTRAGSSAFASTYATLLAFTSSNGANVLTIVAPAVPPDVADRTAAAPQCVPRGRGRPHRSSAPSPSSSSTWTTPSVTRPMSTRSWACRPWRRIERMPGGRDRAGMYRLATLLYPRSQVAEAYRILRTNLEFATDRSAGPDGARHERHAVGRQDRDRRQPVGRGRPGRQARAPRRRRRPQARCPRNLQPAEHPRTDRPAPKPGHEPGRRHPADRGRWPRGPVGRTGPAEPGRDPWLAADALARRHPDRELRPRHLRQPAPGDRHRCGSPECLPERDDPRRRGAPGSPVAPSERPGSPVDGERQRHGRRPQRA